MLLVCYEKPVTKYSASGMKFILSFEHFISFKLAPIPSLAFAIPSQNAPLKKFIMTYIDKV